jgi:hypothetical protein
LERDAVGRLGRPWVIRGPTWERDADSDVIGFRPAAVPLHGSE